MSKSRSAGKTVKFSDEEALSFHAPGRPGKIEIIASKPMATQRDLSLAYSPGVAVALVAIAENPGLAYDYTAKGNPVAEIAQPPYDYPAEGNLVAVISNGTPLLGLGNLGALASELELEGVEVLF